MILPALDSQQIFGLVSMVAVLALWIMVLRGQMRERRWQKQVEAERRAEAAEAERPRDPSRPWG